MHYFVFYLTHVKNGVCDISKLQHFDQSAEMLRSIVY